MSDLDEDKSGVEGATLDEVEVRKLMVLAEGASLVGRIFNLEYVGKPHAVHVIGLLPICVAVTVTRSECGMALAETTFTFGYNLVSGNLSQLSGCDVSLVKAFLQGYTFLG